MNGLTDSIFFPPKFADLKNEIMTRAEWLAVQIDERKNSLHCMKFRHEAEFAELKQKQVKIESDQFLASRKHEGAEVEMPMYFVKSYSVYFQQEKVMKELRTRQRAEMSSLLQDTELYHLRDRRRQLKRLSRSVKING